MVRSGRGSPSLLYSNKNIIVINANIDDNQRAEVQKLRDELQKAVDETKEAIGNFLNVLRD